jgi:DNA-binding NarL/FixJ family response regulator
MTVVDESLAAGAEGFFLERTAASDLIPAAEEILRGGRYVSPSTQQ